MRALAILLLTGTAVLAHDAGGWQYPNECCHDKDCRPIACHAVEETSDGWVYHADGGDIRFGKIVRVSGDGQCHGCWLPDYFKPHDLLGRCLFIPMRMS